MEVSRERHLKPAIYITFALLNAACFDERFVCSYISGNGVAERRDKAQASVTQNDSKAVQSHTVLHAADVRALQLQGWSTCAADTNKDESHLFYQMTQIQCQVFPDLVQTGGLMRRGW